MSSRLIEIFEDEKLVEKVKRRLPYLFQLAELESSRAGQIGMQVGSACEEGGYKEWIVRKEGNAVRVAGRSWMLSGLRL